MSIMRSVLALIFVVIVIAVFAVSRKVHHVIPQTPPPKLDCEHAFQTALDDFNSRTTLEAYLTKGDRDSKWDGDAEEFLKLFLKWESSGFDSESKSITCPLAHKLGQSDCTDPIVLTCIAISEGKNHNKLEPIHFDMLNKALTGFKNGHYNTARAHYIPVLLWEYSSVKNKTAQSVQQKLCADLITTSLTDGSYLPDDTRFILATMNPPDYDLFRGERDRAPYAPSTHQLVSERIKNKANVDPYIKLFLAGWTEDKYYGVNFPWDSGTDESWNELLRREQNAQMLLQKAYKLHPEYPEAPAILISVTRHFANPSDPLKWFAAARKAQIDYPLAYDLLRSCYGYDAHLELTKLHDVVSQLADNDRYDTDAPLQAIITLKYMHDTALVSPLYATPERKHLTAIYMLEAPIAHDAMLKVSQGYELNATDEMKNRYRLYNAGINMLREAYPEASVMFGLTGVNLSQRTIDDYKEFFNRDYSTDSALALSLSTKPRSK